MLFRSSEAATACSDADRASCVASAKKAFVDSGLKEREYKNVKKLGEVMAAAEVYAACKQEADASAEYEKQSQENKITNSMKEQDVKYQTQEFKGLDKTISELSSDRETSNTELSAVMEYYGKIKDRCIAKPESYEERTARRTAEISGLKKALQILESETAFVQRTRRGRSHNMLRAH